MLKRLMVLAIFIAAAAAVARAQTLNQQGIARLNADAQQLWTQDGTPALRQAAQTQLQKLVGRTFAVSGSSATAKIIAVDSIVLDCPTAPGLSRMTRSTIEGQLPINGTWTIGASLRVNVKGSILFVPFNDTFSVDLSVKHVSAGVRVDLDSSDPAAPRIVHVEPPEADLRGHISTSHEARPLFNQLAPHVSKTLLDSLTDDGTLAGIANAFVLAGARQFFESLDLVIATTPEVFGAGGPAPDPVKPIDLEAAALSIAREIREAKTPYGAVVQTRDLVAYMGTWADSINDPKFRLVPDAGSPPDISALDTSAADTGLYLAAVAFQYAASGVGQKPIPRSEVAKRLSATRTLLTMKGQPGDLNRMVLPMSAVKGPLDTDHYVVVFHGTEYLASDTMSRETYAGLLFGLSTVYDVVDDPALKDEARQQIEMAVDYLVRNNWTWRKRDGSYGERWQGALEQQYAWVLAAARANPAKYAELERQYRGVADLVWTRSWAAAMDPHGSYGKFELGGGSLHTILRLETDPARWQRAYQALAIQRRFIGHHQNALFNAVYIAADPTSRATLGAENANLLTRWLQRPRRRFVTDLTSDPTVARVVYSPPTDRRLTFMLAEPTAPVMIAKYPIPVEKRVSSGFVWSESPFRLESGYPSNPDPFIEGEGIDFLLPYWMTRYYGAIKPPRVVSR